MPQIVTAIDIDAPIERVWTVLSDTAGWDSWNPLMKGVKGALRVGEKLSIKFSLDGRVLPISVELEDVKPNERIAWVGPTLKPARFVFSGRHYFELKKLDGGRTRLIHGEQFRGLIPDAEWFWPKAEPKIEPAYVAFNEALKRRVESIN
jgi:hypothetical protein